MSSKQQLIDERLGLSEAPDQESAGMRSRQRSDPRDNRTLNERALTEDRQLTEDERLEMFRSSFFNEALPRIPPIPGYHTCWLTTTNTRDSVQSRIRLGYELIKADELGPQWENLSVKTGEAFAGCVMVNEMIAAKLPQSLYQRFMLEAHHDAPNREQEKLTSVIDTIQQQARNLKAEVVEGDGMKALREKPSAPPRFS